MKKSILFLFLGCLLLSVNAQNPNPSTTLDSVLLDEMDIEHFPGLSTIIVKDGKIVWVESYGFADVEDSIHVEDTTVFLLASVSKLFTATAAMQLYEKGSTDLDADVNHYLPWTVDIPGFVNDSITIRQIMTHTSSINDYFLTTNSYVDYPDASISLANCMGRYFPITGSDYSAANNFKNNAPGTVDSYSNMATALNGYIIEIAGGVPFDDYCDNNIFNQLCMENTAWHFSDFDSSQIARPYLYNSGYTALNHYGWAHYPAATLRSNVFDLANFMIAYLNGGTLGSNNILAPNSINEMLTEQSISPYPGQGLNWFQKEYTHRAGKTMLWGHTGHINGYTTSLFIDTANNIGFCFLANRWGDGTPIGNALYDHALNMAVNASVIPVCAPIEVNELVVQTNDIIIYPNPAQDFIRVEMVLKNNVNYAIYSTTGKLVLSGIVKSENESINISNLAAGLYFLHIENISVKLIKNN